MSVTAPETTARNELIALLETAFADERIPVRSDKLDASLGFKGPVIGVSPVISAPAQNNDKIMQMSIMVQFYGKWQKMVNPDQRVDPALIESYAERLRQAVKSGDPKTDQVWYYRIISVTYVDDPTGNKTRFEANIMAIGTNPAIP